MRYCSPAFAHRLWALGRAVGSRRMRFAGEQHGGAGRASRRRRVRAEVIGEASECPRRMGRCLLPAGRSGVAGREASNCPLRQAPGLLEPCSPRSPPSPVGKLAFDASPEAPVEGEDAARGSYGNIGRCSFFLSSRGCTEDVVVCSCLGDAVDDTRFRLAWVVSAWPCFPRSVGAKRDRWSTYGMWTGAAAAEAGEAGERWRTAKRPELQKRRGGEKEKEASELSNSPGSAESESCGGGQPSDRSYRKGKEERRRKKRLNCQILLAAPRARAAQPISPGASRPTVHSPPNRQAWLRERLPRCPMGWGSVGGPEPRSRLASGTCYMRD
ncbi:uncharacterized protein LOC142091142 isoform X2 [Calonectris borealis]|uniref:uncharacterized protein LOC142091142 isoform X2 n=1 Tax=Calonectris borealis TaxID=1323832 RepID=UPI003F4B1CF8